MIFINLLPDIKLQHLRLVRARRILVSVAVIVFACSVALNSILFFLTTIRQPEEIKNLSEEVEQQVAAINAQQDLESILNKRVKVDLVSQLHKRKVEPERLFSGENYNFLETMTSEDSVVNSVSLNFDTNTFTITGESANNAELIRQVNVLRYIGFEPCTQENVNTRQYPFMVPDDPSPPSGSINDPAPFTFTGSFAGKLFNSRHKGDLELEVPSTIVSQDFIEQPNFGHCYTEFPELQWDPYNGGVFPKPSSPSQNSSVNEES